MGRAVQPPEDRKLTKYRMLLEKRGASLPKNYKPITVSTVVAKTFSTVLYHRLEVVIV